MDKIKVPRHFWDEFSVELQTAIEDLEHYLEIEGE